MESLKGHLLIATPQILAPIFHRSVILMLEHNEDGALGVILNRPTNATVSTLAGKIFPEDFVWEQSLQLGGPVPGPLMVVHAIEDMADQEVIAGVYSTIEATKVQEIISRKPEPCLVIANYSGWGPGQLESEFDRESWLTLPATLQHIFWSGDEDLWQVVRRQANVRTLSEFLGIRQVPSDPNLN
jgi:putative transcriptional regulator